MKTVILHGHLAKKFGKSFQLAVDTPAEAMRLLQANFKEFRQTMLNGYYRFTTGDPLVEDQLFFPFEGTLHIEPVVGGSFKGLFALFLGLPLAGGIFAPLGLGGGLFGGGAAGGLFGAGAAGGLFGGGSFLLGLTVLGVTLLLGAALAPDDADERGDPEERASFIFDGPVNVNEQGGPVPLVYGRMRTGSVVIYGGLDVEEVDI
jgi:predicted phage tail protein